MAATDYRAIAAAFARKYKLNVPIFLAQIGQESGFNPKAKSSAGAVGIAQIMPNYHKDVNPEDPIASLDWAARTMAEAVHRLGSYERALSEYNSGRPDKYLDPNFANGQTYNYVKTIMAAAGKQPVAGSSNGRTLGSDPGSGGSTPSPAAISMPKFDPTQFAGQSLAQIASGQKIDPTETLGALASAKVQYDKLQKQASFGGKLAKLDQPDSPAAPVGTMDPKEVSKWAQFAPGADRQGVPTKPLVLDFVAKIGQLFGKPLTIGTGSNHHQYVSGEHGVVSDHWYGDAADIPMSGGALTLLGQQALIAAGADPKWARKQTGGVYNIGGYNILFNTKVGGNHYNHLHVGLGRIIGRPK